MTNVVLQDSGASPLSPPWFAIFSGSINEICCVFITQAASCLSLSVWPHWRCTTGLPTVGRRWREERISVRMWELSCCCRPRICRASPFHELVFSFVTPHGLLNSVCRTLNPSVAKKWRFMVFCGQCDLQNHRRRLLTVLVKNVHFISHFLCFHLLPLLPCLTQPEAAILESHGIEVPSPSCHSNGEEGEMQEFADQVNHRFSEQVSRLGATQPAA